MGSRLRAAQVAAVKAASAQALVFGCGVGALAAVQAGFHAVATVLILAAIWIGADAAWSRRPQLSAPAPPRDPAIQAEPARLLASLLDQTPAPLLTLEGDGMLRARNRAARALFRTDDRLIDPPAVLLEALEQAPAPGRLTVGVGDGAARRAYAVSLSELHAAGGPMRLAVLLDIEPEVRAAEAAALRELMQVLSHEIMNALTPIASLAATAEELMSGATVGPDERAQARDALGVLARRAEGLARFAEGYRAIARLPVPVRTPVSLSRVVDEAARLFRSRWTARGVSLEASPPLPDVRMVVDVDQLMHAVLNLLANAAEAALEAGGAPRVWLHAGVSPGGGAVVSVRDSGPGVAEADRERVFKPFVTTKANGTGVGLSLARQVARAHGGELSLLPTHPDPGATFELRL